MKKTAEEILKLKLATYISTNRNTTTDQGNAILEAMEEYADQVKPKWVSVEDRLPDHTSNVLVFKANGNGIGIAQYSKEDSCWVQYRKGKLVEFTGITHWMNLPVRPEQ